MSEMTEKLYFNVEGDFITDLARDWLYAENRPYKKVMDLLLACLCGSNYSKSKLVKLANDILTGKKKLTGNTKDGTYDLVDDNTDIIKKYPLFFIRKSMKKKPVKPQKEFVAKTNGYEKRASVNDLDVNELEECGFGWLSPEGEFFPVETNHEKWASEYVNEHYKNEFYSGYHFGNGDFLVAKGWILLHNPTGGQARIEDNLCERTKKQKEFLYNYFRFWGRDEDARAVWRDEQ